MGEHLSLVILILIWEPSMGRYVTVAGTRLEGSGEILRRHCREGMAAELRRERNNPHDPDAIAVYIGVPVFFGWLGQSPRKIGYVKETAAHGLVGRMDSGSRISARVASLYAPVGR